ncbi:MAG: hypothetical protein J6A96_01015 [Clostridia bacterium]|nr:hypothetical protein [Clostridia bacterium]
MIWAFLSILTIFLGTCFIVQAIESAVDKKARLKSNAEEALREQNKELKLKEEKCRKENDELKEVFADSQKKIGILNAELKKAKDEIEKLSVKLSCVENTNADIIWALDIKENELEKSTKQNAELKNKLEFEKEKIKNEVLEWYEEEYIRLFEEKFNAKGYFDNIGTGRFSRAMTGIEGMRDLQIVAKFIPKSDKNRKTDYTTTLYSCDCRDSLDKTHVCKHRMYLAYYLGFMQFYSNEFEKTNKKLIKSVVNKDKKFDKSKVNKTKKNTAQ